ncbi:MAG: ectoine synthase [Proteobacteria bacterium]|nr:ectoine synthase [Pseudomonadota bacterium]
MIVRHRDDLKGTPGELLGEHDTHWRYLHEADAMGFSLVEGRLEAGREAVLRYPDHAEANLILEGEAEVTDLATGETHRLRPGSLYAVKGQRHRFHCLTDIRLVSVFRPALKPGEMPNRPDDG